MPFTTSWSGEGLRDQFAGFLERDAVALAHHEGGELAKLLLLTILK
jgi:hypothetical protein